MTFAAYPVALNLAGRRVLVIGGGKVATRKVERLLLSGARVTVVAPQLSREIEAMNAEVELHEKRFDSSDLDGVSLCFIATSDSPLNRAIAAECRSRNILINVADAPELCDFHVAASIERGDVMIAITSGGASPALSATVKDLIARDLPPSLEKVGALLRLFRERAANDTENQEQRALFYRQLAAEEFLLLVERDPSAAQKFVEDAAGKAGIAVPDGAGAVLRR